MQKLSAKKWNDPVQHNIVVVQVMYIYHCVQLIIQKISNNKEKSMSCLVIHKYTHYHKNYIYFRAKEDSRGKKNITTTSYMYT